MAEASKHVWADATQLEARLDADFYQAHFLEAERRLRRVPTQRFHNLWRDSNRIYIGIAGFSERTQDRDYTPYIRPTDVGMNGEIDWNHIAWCYAEWLDDYSVSGCAKAGDLLVEVKGNTRRVAIVDSSVPANCIVSGSFWRLTLADSVNPRFVLAYLLSNTGQLLKRRWVSNSVISWIDPHSFRRFQIPVPDRRIQDYIGAKVELAELCRARSGSLRAEAIGHFDALLRTSKFGPGADLSNVVDARALTDRLTGEFYLPRYFALEAHLAGLGVPVKPLRSLLRSDITRSSTPERDEAAPIPCILTSDIDPQEIRWRNPSLRVTQSVHDRHGGRLGGRDVVYTSVGPPVGEAAVVLPQFLPMAVGGDVSILRHGEDLHPGFLALYLNSAFGKMQNDRYSRGIRQRRVYPEDIGAFLIPVFGAKDQAYVGERIVRHQVLNELAVDLVNEAKADVEDMIEGTLDVQAIIAGTLKPPTADDIPELAEDDA
ncbi:Restriction endonuclease S subunit [Actinacidiphila alni]|uniref:Restriction endonuclease S subunit n=1 Tax=Actinacidiphila alni TaxID=380248 RepID=A0A1I2KU62_9ACTN|nr:hypothetical protein [Actinacidiphila alni]SFF70455.1 Restriction endonuclease S subunit [Actinacidiphila alni]